MEKVCLTTPEQWAAIVPVIVMGFSLVANFIKPDSPFGKVFHWFALNFSVSKKPPV